ncbi:Cytochrome c [Rubripirellula lacrimiformis]|uniref:Cytochrome c n=1 Tax=Rubripirellula lacrimiformis TaxID=1930273 RepID=A0A517N5S2_9BACT|nr:cytochrome c [Rubripirellula lacrimiformis]QDT02489.1 Cytochrome c [Rubripirellula lacrimiformis]
MWRAVFLVVLTAAVLGCDAPVGPFPPNDVYSLTLAQSRAVSSEGAKSDAAAVTEDWFGTPDHPKLPDSAAQILDLDRLVRAAGPVSSEKDGSHLGLYREHCVTCHSVDGGGAGPASLYQDPHPRNFRHGVFKWKSTLRAAKPTRADLRLVLRHGLVGSAMPSFAAIDPEDDAEDDADASAGASDLDALVDYVMYLSIRGEVERRLMAAAIDELDYDDDSEAVDESLRLAANGDSEGAQVAAEVLDRVVSQWRAAPDQVVSVPPMPVIDGSQLAESIQRGDQIFHGKIANCVGCHGPGGNGQSVLLDFDDWGKEYSTRLGLTPSDRDDMRPFRKAGALPPRPAKPRELTLGVFRGGGDGATLYRRIAEGIAGTPMPGVEVVDEPSGLGLTEEQVWDLVRYLQSMGSDRTGSGAASPVDPPVDSQAESGGAGQGGSGRSGGPA